MAQITDLTWQQIEDAFGSTGLLVVDGTNGVMIKVNALLGTPAMAKSASGVVEALFELRKIAAKAQITINSTATIGERLASFPPDVSGTAVSGFVMQSGQIIVRTPLATSGIVGANN